jgi:anti-sigma factor RsiW
MKTEELEILISRYDDGDLSAQEKAAVEAAVARDPAARVMLEQYRRINRELAALPSGLEGVDFAAFGQRVRRAVGGRTPAPATRDRKLWQQWRWAAPLAAAAALAVLTLPWLLTSRPTSAPQTARVAGPAVTISGAPSVTSVMVAQVSLNPAQVIGAARTAVVTLENHGGGNDEASAAKATFAASKMDGEVLCYAVAREPVKKNGGQAKEREFFLF